MSAPVDAAADVAESKEDAADLDVEEMIQEADTLVKDTQAWRTAHRAELQQQVRNIDADVKSRSWDEADASPAPTGLPASTAPDADALRAALYMSTSTMHASSMSAMPSSDAVAGSKDSALLREEAVQLHARMIAERMRHELGLTDEDEEEGQQNATAARESKEQ
jgi:hypothetical protein